TKASLSRKQHSLIRSSNDSRYSIATLSPHPSTLTQSRLGTVEHLSRPQLGISKLSHQSCILLQRLDRTSPSPSLSSPSSPRLLRTCTSRPRFASYAI